MAETEPVHPCAKWHRLLQTFDFWKGQLTLSENFQLPDDFGIPVYPPRGAVLRSDVMFELPKKTYVGSISCHWCAAESNLEGWFFDDAEADDEEVDGFDV